MHNMFTVAYKCMCNLLICKASSPARPIANIPNFQCCMLGTGLGMRLYMSCIVSCKMRSLALDQCLLICDVDSNRVATTYAVLREGVIWDSYKILSSAYLLDSPNYHHCRPYHHQILKF